jgi:hypothetical protein
MSVHRPSSRSPLARALRVGICALALLFLMADDGISRDEFQCELAVVHLTECCPGLAASMLSCVHGGCDSTVRPELAEARATCIKEKSCEELVQLGACDVSNWAVDPACEAPCTAKVPPCR